MTAKDKPVSKPASDEYRSNYDKIFGGKMKSKIEELRAACGEAPALLICDVDHMGPKMHNFVRLAELLMPELLAFVDAVRDTMSEENMSEEVRHMLKELEKEV